MSMKELAQSIGGALGEVGSFLLSIPGAAKAIARLVTGVADTGISWLDVYKAEYEQRAALIRNETENIISVSKAITKQAVNSVGEDGGKGEKLAEYIMNDMVRKQLNRQAVAAIAIEELRSDPPPKTTIGPSDDWMNKFQRFAEDASSEEIQALWARVLASEIRRPGTVPTRAFRLIDEVDPEVADKFNGMASACASPAIFKCLTNEISFSTKSQLFESGLTTDPGNMSIVLTTEHVIDPSGEQISAFVFDMYAVYVSCDINKCNSANFNNIDEWPVFYDNGEYHVPIIPLTAAGAGVANSVFGDQLNVLERYASKIIENIDGSEVKIFRIENGKLTQLIKTFR